DRRRRLRAVPGQGRRDARELEDLPSGARAHHADRRVCDRRPAHHAAAQGSRLQRNGSAHSALPDLFAGIHRAARRSLRAGRRTARRAGLLRRVGRHEPPVAREVAAAVAPRLPGAREAARRRSAVLPGLYLVQHQHGYITANGIRHVAELLGITRADVEDVVSYYSMFYTKPVGKFVLNVCRTLSCAVNGAERVTEALSTKL